MNSSDTDSAPRARVLTLDVQENHLGAFTRMEHPQCSSASAGDSDLIFLG